ncbi:MAG: paraquat-inducible protein A [Planctomycetes bacterium]|nr:paraquat-inducible protein A [Planctomycetota bacterium]
MNTTRKPRLFAALMLQLVAIGACPLSISAMAENIQSTSDSGDTAHWLDERPGLFLFTWILWGIACLCLIIAMFTPFMSLKIIFKSEQTFSIVQTITLMWSHGMYFLAVLICGFSILFPFYKLYSMYNFLICKKPKPMQVAKLHLIGHLGKWSMLDAFMVSFLLGLTSNQFAIKSELLGGLYVFVIAVLCSILLGVIIKTTYQHQQDQHHEFHHTALSYTILSISTIAMISLYFIPFIEIDDWKLKDNSFTLVSFIMTICDKDNSLALGMLYILLLLILPFCELIILWISPSKLGKHLQLNGIYEFMRHWSCLEVFIFSLLIFLIEGDAFMKTKINLGFYLMIVTLSAYVCKSFARRIINQTSSEDKTPVSNDIAS